MESDHEKSAPARIELLEARPKRLDSVAVVDFVAPDLNLLGHAQSIELEVGSRCGGHGVCGGDRIRIHSSLLPLSEVTDAERRHLTAAELEAGYRLACQCFPSDPALSLRVEIGPRPLN
jgi:ferredoxin